MGEEGLSHINDLGEAAMVNVSGKAAGLRTARAQACMWLPDEVVSLFRGNDLQGPKGPVFHTARIAGIQAAKRTGELIPLCHPIGLDVLDVAFDMTGNELKIETRAVVHARTGVEMEALTAASVAALTVYDMCKAISHDIRITSILLLEKTGGKRDFKRS